MSRSKKVSLKVKKSVTIENLRVLLRQKEGVSEELQLLEFNDEKICDRNVSEIFRKKLYFKFPSNKKTRELHVTSNDTFSSIQSEIILTEGILLDQYSRKTYQRFYDCGLTLYRRS